MKNAEKMERMIFSIKLLAMRDNISNT